MLGFISTRFLSKAVASAPRIKAPKAPEVPIFGMRTSPFALFVKEGFKNDPKGNTGSEKMKELSAQWNKMEINEKEKFFEQSKNLYEEKKSKFLKLSTEEQQALLQEANEKKAAQQARKKLKERREKNRIEERPIQPPNAYALFMKDRLTGCKTDVTVKMKEAIAEWNGLGHVEKQKYTDEASKLKAEYTAKVEKWTLAQKAKDAAEKQVKKDMKKEGKSKGKESMENKTKAKAQKSA